MSPTSVFEVRGSNPEEGQKCNIGFFGLGVILSQFRVRKEVVEVKIHIVDSASTRVNPST